MPRNLSNYRVYVLCEDQFHYYFIRGFLMSQGIVERKIMLTHSLPEGNQSAEQFVRENFADDFIKYARSQENVFLVTMQDIDKAARTPVEAKEEFECLARDKGYGNIKPSDKVLLLFPKQNIETWFEWIQQEDPRGAVNENIDFKSQYRHAKPTAIGRAAGELYTRSRGDVSVCYNAPNSIVFACEEFSHFVASGI